MLDDAPNGDHVRGTCAASDGVGRLGAAHTTTSHRPSSIAAAARHTMPIGVAPPRSTRSAKLTFQPRYSATVDGTNISDSRSVEQHSPVTSFDDSPAYSSASPARSAHCASVNFRSPRNFRSGAYSAIPAMTAFPRRPTLGIVTTAPLVSPAVLDRRAARDLRRSAGLALSAASSLSRRTAPRTVGSGLFRVSRCYNVNRDAAC